MIYTQSRLELKPGIPHDSTELYFYFLFFCHLNVLFFLTFFIVVQVQLCALSSHPSPPPQPSPPPSAVSTPSHYTVHVSFIIVPANPSPFFPIIPSPLSSGHCQPVPNFSVFG